MVRCVIPNAPRRIRDNPPYPKAILRFAGLGIPRRQIFPEHPNLNVTY